MTRTCLMEEGTISGKMAMLLLNSLVPGRFKWNFRQIIFKLILVINGWDISSDIALRWISLEFPDSGSALVQVMAWCRQATSHCLSQCWPRSMSPHGHNLLTLQVSWDFTRSGWLSWIKSSGPKRITEKVGRNQHCDCWWPGALKLWVI